MRKTLLIITALMLIVGCGGSEKEPEKEPINIDELVFKDRRGNTGSSSRSRIHYTKDTNIPYSGKVFRLYENGQKWQEGTLKNGEYNGLYTKWHENGQKETEGNYKNGEKDGKWTLWYENGQKELAVTIKDGKEDGKATKWYGNGQKYREVTLKDGKLISEKCWDEDGNEEDCISWQLSDIRLKDNVTLLEQETSSSPNIYSFNYKWDKDTKWRGVIAQELINTNYSDAVSISPEGYYMVDYARLGFPMTQILN